MSLIVVASAAVVLFDEMIQIGLEVAKMEMPLSNPVVNNSDNPLEPVCMAAFKSCPKTAHDEEIAVDQLVKESGEE
jgi:hypothetical protein